MTCADTNQEGAPDISQAQIADIMSRLDLAGDAIRNHAVIAKRMATLGSDLEKRHAHFAKKLDTLVADHVYNKEVIRLLTARVQKLESELKEIQT